MNELGLEPPFVLVCDNHKSHMSPSISSFCEEHAIHLVGLHPNATHIQQPLDVGVFRSLKQRWNELLEGDCEKAPTQVRKSNVCTIVGKLMDKCDLSGNLKNGFKATGLWPLNFSAIDKTRFINKNIEASSVPVQMYGSERPIYAGSYVELSSGKESDEVESPDTLRDSTVNFPVCSSQVFQEPEVWPLIEPEIQESPPAQTFWESEVLPILEPKIQRPPSPVVFLVPEVFPPTEPEIQEIPF